MAKKFDLKKIGIKVAGVGSGAVVSLGANKLVPNMNKKLRGILKIGIGAVAPELAPKSEFLSNAGSGMIAGGAIELASEMVPELVSGVEDTTTDTDIEGIEEDYKVDEDPVTGLEDDPINGAEDVVIE